MRGKMPGNSHKKKAGPVLPLGRGGKSRRSASTMPMMQRGGKSVKAPGAYG